MASKKAFIYFIFFNLGAPERALIPTAPEFQCIYVFLQFSPCPAPSVTQTAEGDNKFNLISLNPTQHWLNLLSDCHSISVMTSNSSVKSTSKFFKKKYNCIISSPLNFDRKKGKV